MVAIGVRLGRPLVVYAGSVALAALLVAPPTAGGSVPQRQELRQESSSSLDKAPSSSYPRLRPAFALETGLAGPPLVAGDGSWWLTSRDGQLVLLAPHDSLKWSIGLGASIKGGATLGEGGLLFVPTAKNSIIAMEPRGVERWRSGAPWGIDGPLAWVPGQGLVFVSQDRHVHWLDLSARLLQRSKLPAPRSAGPVAAGSSVAVGTEAGQVLVWMGRARRVRVDLPRPVRAIAGTSHHDLLALAGTQAHAIAGSSVRWQRSDVASIGLAVRSPESPSGSQAVLAYATGDVEWLDAQGNTLAACHAGWSKTVGLVGELAASPECAWISSNAGTLWQCCADGRVSELPLTRASLSRPVLDGAHGRVLVGSSEREVWSIPLLTGGARKGAESAVRKP